MGIRRRRMLAIGCCVGLSIMVVRPAAGEPNTSRRVAPRDDVVLGAIDMSQESFAAGEAEYVVLGRDDVFADNLAGAPLAGTRGPLLFTTGGGGEALRPEVRAEIQRVREARDCGQGVSIYILGGPSAVSSEAEAELRDLGYCPQRFNGASRVETSVLIADHVADATGSTQVLVARADDWADAATGGAYAALSGAPVVVTPSDVLHPAVDQYLAFRRPSDVVLLGGTVALSDAVLAAANEYGRARRVAGGARDATAAAIATDLWTGWYTGAGEPPGVMLLNGYAATGWAYALAGAGLSAIEGAPQLYSEADTLPSATRAHLESRPPAFVVVAGPEALVSAGVADEATALADGALTTPDPGAATTDEAPALPPPAQGESEGVPEGESGIVGGPDGREVPPPPPGQPDALPASLGEHFGIEAPDAGGFVGLPPEGLPSGELPNRMPSLDDLPEDLLGVQLSHPQTNATLWEWNQLSYDGLPYPVGRLYASSDGGVTYSGSCSATAIGANQVLTAAHCFFDFSGQPTYTHFSFCPDMFGTAVSAGCWVGTVNDAYVDQMYLDNAGAYYVDYGVLRVAPNASGQRLGDVVGSFPVQMDGDLYTSNRFTIGYPSEGMYAATSGSPVAQCSDTSCYPYYCWSPVGQTYDWETTGYFRSVGFGCYLNGGWSGGPIFQYADGQYYLVSVTSTMGNQVSYSCTFPRCSWYGQNMWGPVFRYERFVTVWNAAQ